MAQTLTLTQRRERFAECRWSARSTEPEVFTFERVEPQTAALSCHAPLRPKKRCTRVMYPAKVRMHLPPPERSTVKRVLLALVVVLLWQIWTEEPELELTPLNAPQTGPACLSSSPACLSSSPACLSSNPAYLSSSPDSPATESPAHEPEHSGFESASNSYVVALLVAHRLGSD